MSSKSEEPTSDSTTASAAPQQPAENEAKRRVPLPAEPEAKRMKKEPPAITTTVETVAVAPGTAVPANGQQLAVKLVTPSVASVPSATVAANPTLVGTPGTAIQCKQEPASTAAVATTEKLVAAKPTTGSGSGRPESGQIAAAHPGATIGTRVSPDLVKTKVVLGSSANDPVEEGGNAELTAAAAAAAATTVSAEPVAAAVAASTPPAAPQAQPPLKALKMSHLRTKYTSELEYMLREFRKLERQLLGAKGATQIEESAGSRERREKLHSFILHLEDTIRQIELGCKLEAEGKSTVHVGVAGPDQHGNSTASTDATAQARAKRNRADSSALSDLTQEKEEEENVQKLEEHILANLLPVKVRLKKQLAAQQGATKNPAGMPAMRRGSLPAEGDRGKGTFAAAAEQRRKEAEALAAQQHMPAEPVHPDNTHFGKPLGRRGSSLTQKLHGQTLGSKGRPHGHGVGFSKPATEEPADGASRNIIYAGVAPGSKQVASGVAVASSVHKMVIDNPHLQNTAADSSRTHAAKSESVPQAATAATPQKTIVASIGTIATKAPAPEKVRVVQYPKSAASIPAQRPSNHIVTSPQGGLPEIISSATAKALKEKLDDPALPDDERRKLRRKLKKKLLLRRAKRREFERHRQAALQHSAQVAPKAGAGRKKSMGGKVNGKKRGPRSVEYICALCSEAYSSVCEYNPWWALAQHECPKCRKNQIPRVDISAPANAIEYHPALLAHADDNGASAAAANAAAAAAEQVAPAQISSPSKYPINSLHTMSGDMKYASDSEFGSDLSDITDGNLSDISLDSNDSDADVLASLTPAEKAEYERFGFEYKGPKLSDSVASRLLVLMLHANGCPCRHKNQKQRDVCRSTKFMMLHVRDCHGTTSNFDVCPFPWCRKVKHLLYHLVSCADPLTCSICSPTDLPKGMDELIGLNNHRLKRQRDRIIASHKIRQQQLKTQHQALKPPAAASTKKTISQRAQHPGDPSSKPKAVVSRPKPRAAVPATGRLLKSLKPAATAARKTGSVFPGVTAVLTKAANGKPTPAKLAIAKAISAGTSIAGATIIQSSAVSEMPLQQQSIVQNPVPVNVKPAVTSKVSQPSAGAAAATSVAQVKTLPAPETQIAPAVRLPIQASPVTTKKAPTPMQATQTAVSTTAAPTAPTAPYVAAARRTQTTEVAATSALPLTSTAAEAQAPESVQITPVAVSEAASVVLGTAAPLAASVATSTTANTTTRVNGATSVTSVATPAASAQGNVPTTGTIVADTVNAKPMKNEAPAASTTAGLPGTTALQQSKIKGKDDVIVSAQAVQGAAISKSIKIDAAELEGPNPPILGEGNALATPSATIANNAVKHAGNVESPVAAVKLEDSTTSATQPSKTQTRSAQAQAQGQESQATPTTVRPDVNCAEEDIAKLAAPLERPTGMINGGRQLSRHQV